MIRKKTTFSISSLIIELFTTTEMCNFSCLINTQLENIGKKFETHQLTKIQLMFDEKFQFQFTDLKVSIGLPETTPAALPLDFANILAPV